jgi:hypothetical protein
VYEPTFHEVLVVVVDRAPGIVELHRVPAALGRATLFRGARFVVPDPRELSPATHPSDLTELDAPRLEAIERASSRLPDRDDPPRDDYRDGMTVVIQRGAEVLGSGYPVGSGPLGHTELARVVLEILVDVFPREREHIAPLLGYFPARAAGAPAKKERR